MSDKIAEADGILKDYAEKDSTIDSGNLFHAAHIYREAFIAEQAEHFEWAKRQTEWAAEHQQKHAQMKDAFKRSLIALEHIARFSTDTLMAQCAGEAHNVCQALVNKTFRGGESDE